MAEIRIPFNRPGQTGLEQTYMADALQRGHLSGDGFYTKKCNALLENALGAGKVMLTTSCTHALEMAALLLDIQPGDEVIVPSFTFVSSINAFVLRGAKPVFADIRPDTLNLDEKQLESLVTEKTRAIVPVHYAGVGCEMAVITEVARKYNLAVIEDNAQGLFARYEGQNLGTFGQMSAVSFHETKNFVCGEGGAIFLNDPRYFERAEIIREKGTNRGRFFRGQVDKYTWVDVGSSYLPSEILAAFLYAQLEARDTITAKRRAIFEFYRENLAEWSRETGVRTPTIPANCEQPYHMFYLLFGSLTERTAFINHMRSRGIQTSFHYLPLHLSDMGRQWGYVEGDCPVTEQLSDCLVRLPFYNDITRAELEEVAATVRAFSGGLVGSNAN
jgi:dTDP-4-amino-4,6-dideoxygalactose transaminase